MAQARSEGAFQLCYGLPLLERWMCEDKGV